MLIIKNRRKTFPCECFKNARTLLAETRNTRGERERERERERGREGDGDERAFNRKKDD